MTRVSAAIGVGIAAAIAFLLVFNHFRCCQGEGGFAQNASIGGLAAVGLFVVSIFAQPAWRSQPFVCVTMAVILFIAIGAIVMMARPSWDSYIFNRPLHLGWRAAGVFATATITTYLLSMATARWTARRQNA